MLNVSHFGVLTRMDCQNEGADVGDQGAAVTIRSGAKSYKSTRVVKVFEDVNLTVPTGKIYGLLGPSGCGKTSIIRSILDQVKLDKGTVRVFGHQPGTKESGVPGPTVGYMPQETALFETMTIGECFWYYGTMVDMSNADIDRKRKYFQVLLKLPSMNKLTSKLSGGEGRRVSFAVALLHQPKLLILDEPTVGIDPILKDCVWKHLVHLSNEGNTTIILTTHYIEEAKTAHRIGLLHNGTLVVEDSTDVLLRKYNCFTLEDVYLKVCTGNVNLGAVDNAISDLEDSTSLSSTAAKIPSSDKVYQKKKSQNEITGCLLHELEIRRNRFISIIVKNLLFLFRFPGAVSVMLLLPSITLILVNFSISSYIGPLTMTVVNSDTGNFSNDFLSFINPDMINLATSDSLVTAEKDVFEHRVNGMIHFHSNFSTLLNKKFDTGIITDRETLKMKMLTVYVDNINIQKQVRMSYHILYQFAEYLQYWSNYSSFFEFPIIYNEAVHFAVQNPSIDVTKFNIYCISLYFVALTGTFLMLSVEIKMGSLERTFVAGVSSAEVLLGLMTVQVPLVVLQSVTITIFFSLLHGGIMMGSWVLMCVLFCSISLSGSAFGIFLSVISTQGHLIILFCAFYMVASGCVNAAINPIEAMPYYFQYFCKATPLYYPVHAVLDIIQRGWGLSHCSVAGGLLVAASWTLGFFILSTIRLIFLKSRK